MTTREFIQHLLLNAELEDNVSIEVQIPDKRVGSFISFEPAHVTRIGDDSYHETLIECKPYKKEE